MMNEASLLERGSGVIPTKAVVPMTLTLSVACGHEPHGLPDLLGSIQIRRIMILSPCLLFLEV